jgi:hypothetical protein
MSSDLKVVLKQLELLNSVPPKKGGDLKEIR